MKENASSLRGPQPGSAKTALVDARDALVGGGELGALMRSMDWSQTPVGPIAQWPQSLRTAVSILLESKFGMMVAWGPEFTHFYNDAYRPILGSTRHPSLGMRVPDVFPELWPTLGPLLEGVRQGSAVSFEDLLVPVDRHGYLEECYFTFSYSPIRDETGDVGGVHVTATETTARVLSERRMRTLRDIAARPTAARREEEVWERVAEALGENLLDLPFSLLYRAGPQHGTATLAASVAVDADGPGAPALIDLTHPAPASWPLARVARGGTPVLVTDVRERCGDLSNGRWPEPPHSALVLPLSRPGVEQPYGYLVAGISPRRAWDDDYRGFLGLAADQIATALAAVKFAPRAPPARRGGEESFLLAGGEMGALIRSIDWSPNPLGPVERWPQSLRTSVSTMLRSPYPIILFWGPERIMLYNDPFRPILGAKHPQTMGARGREALAEEWKLLGPLMDKSLETGEPIFIENGNVNFARRPGGLREESYFTWSYNPTIGETGEIAGLFAIASETTRQVVGDRRLAILRELSLRTALSKKVEDTFRSLEEVLAQAGLDVPFALLYVIEGGRARLVSCAGLPRGAPAAPLELELGDSTPWPLASVAHSRQEALVEDLHEKAGPLPGGPWPEPATRALLLPVPMGADAETVGVLVAGLSPLRTLDDEYRGFLQLLARQLAASISSARAYEEERQRAEQLAQLDQAKTAFFSNVSHEFRTPLTLILGPIEDALSRTKQSLEGEKLELVRRNAMRLYKMVSTLLDFSRMEAGRAQATYVPMDLAAFTASLASAFESAAQSAGLGLEVWCPPLPEPVYVDPELWEKIVLNLMSNAVKYTHQGEVRVGLEWKDAQAVLTVRDTGVGIPEEELPRVFERFYRVRVTQGRSHEGTGIGLALVQELVKLHGGSVEVASTLGQGTTFTVRLPRGSAHLPPERVEHTPRSRAFAASAAPFVEEAQRWTLGSPSPETPAPEAWEDTAPAVSAELSRSRLLFVDDNADLRAYVVGLLGRLFPHIETATNGLEALERVRVRPPDLILSDVMMPGLDGFGLVRALRGDEHTRAIPIILLTARAGDESTVEGLESGADDYLVKPFSARELIARVRTQLEMARVRREVARHALTEERLLATVKARDEWLSVVSHELRTPLSALALSAQSFIRSTTSETVRLSPEAARAKAQAVQKNLQRLTEQVEQLVDMAELVSGRLRLALEEVDVTSVVAAVVAEAGSKAASAGSAVSWSAGTPVVGRFDRARLHQLVEGLLDNALKFGARRPMEVSVTREENLARIRIVDHGGGVALEDRERVFGRFERAASTRNYGGFGLGLWMARHIAEAHAGTVSLTPTEGGGATVTVLLPLSAPSP